MDLCFLAFFTLEIALKLYGFGAAYLRELFNLVDAAIVLGSLAITVVAIDIGASAAGGGTLLRSLPILRVVKVAWVRVWVRVRVTVTVRIRVGQG